MKSTLPDDDEDEGSQYNDTATHRCHHFEHTASLDDVKICIVTPSNIIILYYDNYNSIILLYYIIIILYYNDM